MKTQIKLSAAAIALVGAFGKTLFSVWLAITIGAIPILVLVTRTQAASLITRAEGLARAQGDPLLGPGRGGGEGGGHPGRWIAEGGRATLREGVARRGRKRGERGEEESGAGLHGAPFTAQAATMRIASAPGFDMVSWVSVNMRDAVSAKTRMVEASLRSATGTTSTR